MTNIQRSKVKMQANQSIPKSVASQEARRATEGETDSAQPAVHSGSDSEVVARAQRRQFSSADKRRILNAADHCSKPGEIGALMRREGVYSSSLSTWRRQRETAELAAVAPQKRGPRIDPARAPALHLAQITRERDSLREQLVKARLVIDVQKKVATLLELLSPDNKFGSI